MKSNVSKIKTINRSLNKIKPYFGDGSYIFISYSHKDLNEVLPLIIELQKNYNVWYDEGIDPGTEWDDNIAKHIENCSYFIACMSKNYLNSSNCKDELNYARDLDKNRLIIYYEKVELPSGMKMRLNRLQNIHKYTYNFEEDFYDKLYQSVGLNECKISVEIDDNTNSVSLESSTSATINTQVNNLQVSSIVSLFNDYNYDKNISSKIIQVFKEFNINVTIARVFRGPTVTRFDIEVQSDVSIKKIKSTFMYIELALNTANVRFIVHVENTPYISIEVPNSNKEIVGIKEVLQSNEFLNSKSNSLSCVLGKQLDGKYAVLDISLAPHVLISGLAGSGKTLAVNSIILNLMLKYSPSDVRLILADVNMCFCDCFKNAPHLLFNSIINTRFECNAMLKWAVNEMESRYNAFQNANVCSIDEYNDTALTQGKEKLPRLVIIIENLSDFLLSDNIEFIQNMSLLSRKARASGIHLIISDSKFDKSILPDSFNFPTRLVFKTFRHISIAMIQTEGAESLNGNGDCLYAFNCADVKRVQCAYVTDDEIKTAINHISKAYDSNYDDSAYLKIQNYCHVLEKLEEVDSDALAIKALKLAVEVGSISISLLQRRFAIGFNRAGKFVDWMVENHYVSEVMKSGKRETLMTKEEFKEKFGDNNDI